MAKTPNKFTHKCKICEDETDMEFTFHKWDNKFMRVYLCDNCARAITTQQVIWYSRTYLKDDDGKYIVNK